MMFQLQSQTDTLSANQNYPLKYKNLNYFFPSYEQCL